LEDQCFWDLSSTHCAALLETLAAENGTALGGTEGNGGFFAALRAIGLGFGAHLNRGTVATTFRAFGLAGFAPLGLVFEAFVGKKHLFACGENKLGTTLRALQHLIVIFHEPLPLDPARVRGRELGSVGQYREGSPG
jgi:hypothetical protein